MDELEFWHEAWAAGRVASRVRQPDKLLDMHWPSLHVEQGSRVLVPLSGKSSDLAWLGSHGFISVGVEISAIPCREFFSELGVIPDHTICGPFVKWQGSGVTILQGDFFDLDGRYDAAVDRGALVALPPPTRERYSKHLKTCLSPGARLLLVTTEYDPIRLVGPPYPVFPDEVHRLFPGSIELARGSLRRRRWDRIGGAEAVIWATRVDGCIRDR